MILHVDMDAFFASVEQLDDPALLGRCVLVGGESHRGVVAACSYEARKLGIHSAMPMFQALRRCPDAVVVAPRRGRYKEISKRIMAVLDGFSPLVEPVSIDEAYVDIAGCLDRMGGPRQVGQAVKRQIRSTVRLSCSVGVAPLKFLAKIASDLEKPDGLTVIEPDRMTAFIAALPLAKVPGVGPKMLARLNGLGMHTLADVRRQRPETLAARLGRFGRRLHELSMGNDAGRVAPSGPPKSVSAEETLPRNTRDRALLERHLLRQSDDVARQLRNLRFRARTVTLKIKHADFRQITRQMPLDRPTQAAGPIYAAARLLLARYPSTNAVRLIGVGTAGLVPADTPIQRDLFSGGPSPGENWERVDRAVDRIGQRFGKGAVRRANLAADPSAPGGPGMRNPSGNTTL